MCYGISEKDILEEKESLKRVKEDLQRLFQPKKISNVGTVFILTDTKFEDMFESNILVAHMNGLTDRVPVNFSVLALKQCIFAGEARYALALKANFGGTIKKTGSSHCVEWLWKGDRKLEITEALQALFNMV